MKCDQTPDAVEIRHLGKMATLAVNYKKINLQGFIVTSQQIFKCHVPHDSPITDEQATQSCLEDARQFVAYERLKGYTVEASDKAGNIY